MSGFVDVIPLASTVFCTLADSYRDEKRWKTYDATDRFLLATLPLILVRAYLHTLKCFQMLSAPAARKKVNGSPQAGWKPCCRTKFFMKCFIEHYRNLP